MRRTIWLLTLILVLTATVIAACGEESASTTEDTMMDDTMTTTMDDANTMDEDAMMDDGATMTIPEAMPGAYTDLTPEQAKYLIETTPNLVVLDVSPNYADGHLPGAVNYYIGDGSLEAAIPMLDKSVPYLVYCHVDSASIGGAEALVNAGFPTVYRLEGNYAAWVEAGYPVEM